MNRAVLQRLLMTKTSQAQRAPWGGTSMGMEDPREELRKERERRAAAAKASPPAGSQAASVTGMTKNVATSAQSKPDLRPEPSQSKKQPAVDFLGDI